MDWESIFSTAFTQALGPTMLVYALAAIGLNVQFGYTGLLNFGQAAFAAMGAYGMALIVSDKGFGLSFWLGIIVGLVAAVILALILGMPTLRLRADYLAIATIAAAEIVRRLFRATTWSEHTGGSDGLRGFSATFYDMNPYDERFTHTVSVAWIVIGLSLLLVAAAILVPLRTKPSVATVDERTARRRTARYLTRNREVLVPVGAACVVAGLVAEYGGDVAGQSIGGLLAAAGLFAAVVVWWLRWRGPSSGLATSPLGRRFAGRERQIGAGSVIAMIVGAVLLATGSGAFELTYSPVDQWVMTVGWSLVALSLLFVGLAIHSPWGRVLKGIREDEEAVRSLGKNVFAYKMQALVIGGVIGALAGFIFALSRSNVQPDNYSTDFTFYFYVAMIIGGAARLFGPVLGAAILWFMYNFLERFLNELVVNDYVPDSVLTTTQVGPVVFFMVGASMVLLLIFRPQGIFGDRREMALDVR